MEQSIPDFVKDTFSEETDFEHLHFDDNTETHSEREPAMEDNNNYREESVPWTESDLDSANTQSFTNSDMELKTMNCSENSKDGLLNEHSVKPGSMLYESWDDYYSDENKIQAQDQQLSLQEEVIEDESETDAGTSDLHQMKNEQAHIQVEDVSFLEMVLPEGTYMVMEEEMVEMEDMLDEPEDKISTSEEDPDQSGDEIKEFTEDDHVRVEEGLADYPSDLSQSENEGCSKSHEGEPSTHISNELDKMYTDDEHHFHQVENLGITSGDDDTESKDGCMNPTVKNEMLDIESISWKFGDDISFQTEHDDKHLCVRHPFLNDGVDADEDNNGSSNSGEDGDSRTFENFQSIGQMDRSSEGYINEQADYNSDISSDEDYSRSHEEEHDPIAYTHKEEKSIAFHDKEHTFTKDFVEDWNSIKCEKADMEDTDSQIPEICDVRGLSSIPAFPETGMVGLKMESSSGYGTHSSENSYSIVSKSHTSGSQSVKSDQNNKEHSSEPLEVSNIGEKINSFLPETFLNLMDEDNLKLDEYDWNVNEEDAICDEEDNFLEDLENDEEKMDRDWENEQARIEAFNRYYKLVEGEENVGRSHKVTFCLEPVSTFYEEEYSSSEEELSKNSYVTGFLPEDFSSVNTDQSNIEHNSKASEISDAGECINTRLPETLWSTISQMDEDNPKLDEHDPDVHGDDDFHKPNLNKVICDDKEHFLEEQNNAEQEIERDLEQEQAGTEVMNLYYDEFTVDEKIKVTSMFSLDQESSQNEEENESSEQESNTEDDTNSNMNTEDQSESDEPQERRLCAGRPKFLPKGLQKPDKKLMKPKSKCLVLLRSVLAVSLATVVGVLSYWWATDSLDWIY